MPHTSALFTLPFRSLADLASIQLRTQAVAGHLGLTLTEQIKLTAAITTLAAPLVRAGRHGEVSWRVEEGGDPMLVVRIHDTSELLIPLPAQPPRITETLLQRGAVDAINFLEEQSGRFTILRKAVPLLGQPGFSLDAVRAAVGEAEADLLEHLEARELVLLDTLADSQVRLQQVEHMHAELTETNRGVVALYDELETLHRVGRVVASQLDLDSLVQAITRATTEISGAEFGAFYAKEPEADCFRRQAVAGVLADEAEACQVLSLEELYCGQATTEEVLRLDDVARPGACQALTYALLARSYLVVSVRDAEGTLTGALLFIHRTPGAFTERTERILASVATQLAMGLENARLYQNVQAASAAKDQFLAMLSHELRTPLNPAFVVLASLEGREDLPADVVSDLQIIRRNLKLEARLIDDLLDITRIVRGKITLQSERVDLHDLLLAVRDVCQEQTAQQRVQVELALAAPRCTVMGDPARLQQVFWNLLSNAVKFSAGGRVTIRSAQEGEAICVQVQDNGRGLAPSTLELIFHPFEQGDAQVPVAFGGLGLGLAICKSIVDGHRGSITVASPGVGGGATFSVRLPLTEAAVPPTIPPSTLAGPPTPEVAGTARILLVEDHIDTVQTLARLLVRRGYQVKTATTCGEALAVAEQNEFDLIISDVGLPDQSGLDLMRELSAKYRVPGIALSGYGMESDVERSHAAGFTAHLTKPLDFVALEHAIQGVLGRC